MANNRMAIVCRKCKLGIAIAKFYPPIIEKQSGWQSIPNQERVNKFFVRHAHSDKEDYDWSVYGGHQYYLGYEDKGKWVYDTLEEEESDGE